MIKKIMITLLILLVVGGVAWFLLLRPESISQDSITASFIEHEEAFETVAAYLDENDIPAEITGFLSMENSYGIATNDSNKFRAFAEGIEELASEDCTKIISDGDTVEFVYPGTGGYFNKLYGSVIFNGEKKVEGKSTVPLNTNGWHLYIAQA